MGAIISFCNESNIILYTSLSVIVPYYWTNELHPGYCVSYSTGKVWFTATAEISFDTNIGYLYFPMSRNQSVGLRYGIPLLKEEDYMTYYNITKDEADQIISSPDDIVANNFDDVYHKYVGSEQNLLVQIFGFYANKNKKITIRDGPKGCVIKPHPYIPGKHIQIVSANFPPLTMYVEETQPKTQSRLNDIFDIFEYKNEIENII